MINILSEIRKIRNFFVRDEYLASRLNELVNPDFKYKVNNPAPFFTHFDRGNELLAVGSGTGNSVIVDNSSYGVAEISTGTTSTGRCAVLGKIQNTGTRPFKHSQIGSIYFAALINKITAMPDATEDYVCPIGIFNVESSNNPKGVFFNLDRTVSPTNWVVKTQGTTSNSIDTGIAVGTNQTLEIVVDALFAKAYFLINGVQIHSEDIAARLFDATVSYMFGINIFKIAGSTARSIFVDALMYKVNLDSAIL